MKLNEMMERKAGDLDKVKNYSSGELDISDETITSLEGCPKEVNGTFDCSHNELISMEGCPEQIHNWLKCSYNKLTSLEGCPGIIPGTLSCRNNDLTSFEHFPKYIKFDCRIQFNNFTSFKDIDKHIEFIGGELYATGMNITSGYSDLFGIDGLREILIDNRTIEKIINKYLPEKDLIEFQDEMIKAGLESYL